LRGKKRKYSFFNENQPLPVVGEKKVSRGDMREKKDEGQAGLFTQGDYLLIAQARGRK